MENWFLYMRLVEFPDWTWKFFPKKNRIDTEKSFRNLIKAIRNQIVFTTIPCLFGKIVTKSDTNFHSVRLLFKINRGAWGKYNLISVRFNMISERFLRVDLDFVRTPTGPLIWRAVSHSREHADWLAASVKVSQPVSQS